MQDELVRLMPYRSGHFLLESGHHGDKWMDLQLLCLRPEPIERLAVEIARRLAKHDVEVVCGPLVEGAFVALMVASRLHVPFTYAERFEDARPGTLYPVAYRVPRILHAEVRGKRVAIVNDVINAGSAVRGTFTDLERCGANVVAIGALAVLGEWTSRFAAENKLVLESLAFFPNVFWAPSECPLCARGIPVTDPLG